MTLEFKTEIVDKGVLTAREIEIVSLVCSAQTDKQIARLLTISLHTVTNHLEHIYDKLEISSQVINKRCALLRVAIAGGMVRMLCLVLAVSAGMQADNQAMAARVRVGRPSVSRRYQ